MMVFMSASSASRVEVLSRKTSSNCAGLCWRARNRFSTVIWSGKSGEAPRQLAPRRHALGLHQTVALLEDLLGHAVEGAGQLADFVRRADRHASAPVSARNSARRG